MATQDNLNFVQQLYVAYYGRPADSAGLQYWAERADTNGQGSIIAAFGESKEFQDEYGNLSNEARVNNLYQQLFGRDAEPEGLTYYTGVLDRGEKALSDIAVTIFNSAEGADEDVFDARIGAANAYTEQFGGSAYDAQDGRDVILAIVPDDNGSGDDTDDSSDTGEGENGSGPEVDEVLVGKLQSLQAEYKDWVDYRKTMTDDGSPITNQEFYQRFEAAEDALDQAYAQKPTSEIKAEYDAAKAQRDQAREAVDEAFTKTTAAGEDATQNEIQAELAALENDVNQSGGIVENGVAQPGDSAGLEADSYNEFKSKADALEIAQDGFADAQQTLDVRNALQDEFEDFMYAEEDLASLTLTISKTEDYYSEPDNQYEVPVSIEGDVSATNKEDLFLFYGADATITGFDPENGDQLFIGEQFTRTDLAAGVDIGATAQGSDSDLDVFFQQAGNDTILTFEDAVDEGSATNDPFMAEVTLTGVNMDNLSVDNGFVSIA